MKNWKPVAVASWFIRLPQSFIGYRMLVFSVTLFIAMLESGCKKCPYFQRNFIGHNCISEMNTMEGPLNEITIFRLPFPWPYVTIVYLLRTWEEKGGQSLWLKVQKCVQQGHLPRSKLLGWNLPLVTLHSKISRQITIFLHSNARNCS